MTTLGLVFDMRSPFMCTDMHIISLNLLWFHHFLLKTNIHCSYGCTRRRNQVINEGQFLLILKEGHGKFSTKLHTIETIFFDIFMKSDVHKI